MKGQYQVLVEVMLVLVGIFITSFVISTFKTVEDSATNISVEDDFNAVANHVITGLLKVSTNDNSIVRVTVPDKISDHVYKIKLGGDEISVVSLKDNTVNVTRKIFNIGQVDRITVSEVVSSARIIEIVSDADGIRVRRLLPGVL